METHRICALVSSVAEALEREYVYPDRGRAAAERLRDAARAGAFADTTASELAERVTACLHQATEDLHLRLILREEDPTDLVDEEAYQAHWAERARHSAGGVRCVERLEGNVAVVALEPFLGLPHHAGPWLSAAMRLCVGARAVVVDVRRCVGGTPEAVALLCSHLTGDEPVHLIDVTTSQRTQQFWTTAGVAQVVPDECPVRVLVSRDTFSGGEQLAFTLQDIGRALVVGETTRGGAHPRVGLKVAERLELALPVARPHSPRTGESWEGVGVRPDLPCRAEDALDVAVASVGVGREV